jgi:pSer/pThr/pTyr-binding forkhead associated (FHA) protein
VILYTPGEGFYLIDLNSMNGSFVNGRRVFHRQLLQDGDRLRIGTIEFRFFNSLRTRSIEPIHAEILARFTHFQPYSEESMDFSALEVPEILFGSQRE